MKGSLDGARFIIYDSVDLFVGMMERQGIIVIDGLSFNLEKISYLTSKDRPIFYLTTWPARGLQRGRRQQVPAVGHGGASWPGRRLLRGQRRRRRRAQLRRARAKMTASARRPWSLLLARVVVVVQRATASFLFCLLEQLMVRIQ